MTWQVVHREDGRIEFARDGVGHPAHWCKNGIHGCDGECSDPTFPGRKPKVGDIALCGAGYPGLIASDELQLVTYPDGNTAQAYVGTHLTGDGKPWSSRNPCILGSILELVNGPSQLDQYLAERAVAGWPLILT